MFTFYRWLSMHGNLFLVWSACDEIDSAYAQHAIKYACYNFRKWLKNPLLKCKFRIKIKILNNRLGTYLIGPKRRFWNKIYLDISQQKFGSTYAHFAQSPKCSNIEILAKIEGKEAKFFSKIYEGHMRIWFRSKKIQNYLMLVYL